MSRRGPQSSVRLGEAIDAAELAEITRRLVRIDSTNPPGNEHAAATALVTIAQEAGLHAELVPVGNGRSNATVRLPGDGSDPRRLLYCGHLDTVVTGGDPWKYHPLGADVIDGEIWGRGSVDMKGGLAAMLVALVALHRTGTRLSGEVVLAATVGEEVDCVGARHLLATGGMDGVAWLVVGEPTGLDLVIAHKGCLRIRVTTRGVASHASRPELGRNAVLAMARLLPLLADIDVSGVPHALLTPSTIAPTLVSGGSAVNIVPDECSAEFDIRTGPEQSTDDLMSRFDAVARRFGEDVANEGIDVTTELSYERAPMQTPSDELLVATFQRTFAEVTRRSCAPRGESYFTDASILQPPTAVPTLVFGPGDPSLMHQTNERVRINDLLIASRVLAALPLALW